MPRFNSMKTYNEYIKEQKKRKKVRKVMVSDDKLDIIDRRENREDSKLNFKEDDWRY